MNILWYGFELFVNLVQSVIFCDFIVKYFKYNENLKHKNLLSGIFILITFITISVINLYFVYEHFFAVIYIIEMFIFAAVFLNGKNLEKLLVSISIHCIVAAISALVMFVFVDLFGESANDVISQEFNLVRLKIIFCINIIFFYITRLVIKIKNSNNHMKISDWIILIAVPVISITFIFSIVMIIINKENSVIETISTSVAVFSVLLLNAVVYMIIRWKDKNNIMMLENTLLKQEKELQQKHILHVEELHNETKILKHDLKLYSECIHTLSENIELSNISSDNFIAIEKLKKYIADVTENIKNIDYTEVTGNAAVDSVINYKVGLARKNNINVNLSLLYKVQKISDVDISILLGNLLDNAIEACVYMKDIYNNEKQIDISIYKKKAYVVITVANTINESILKNNPDFITTKKNKDGHGLGIKSIKNIIKKYNGMIDNFEENGIFVMKIMLVEE